MCCATASAEQFLRAETIKILFGVIALVWVLGGTVGKLMNKLSGGNPLIGSAGVSVVPMALGFQVVGQRELKFLLMHAMGPNVAGVIGSAVAAGVLLSLFG